MLVSVGLSLAMSGCVIQVPASMPQTEAVQNETEATSPRPPAPSTADKAACAYLGRVLLDAPAPSNDPAAASAYFLEAAGKLDDHGRVADNPDIAVTFGELASTFALVSDAISQGVEIDGAALFGVQQAFGNAADVCEI